jgi:UDP-glucose 4-epimerase
MHYYKNSFRDKKVLITGGLGFIGSNLAITLIDYGAMVTVIDATIKNHGANLFNIDPIKNSLKVINFDLRNSTGLGRAIKGFDFIFHLAGQVSHSRSMVDPSEDMELNTLSTINLLEACRKNNPEVRLIFTSTRQVYGVQKILPVKESQPLIPSDINGINKLTAELYHNLYTEVYNLKSITFRLTNTYGPRQQIKNNEQGFIGIFIRNALKGETINIYGTGEQIRDFNYVSDVVSALIIGALNLECYGKTFNIGSDIFYSINEVAQTLNEITGVKYINVDFPIEKQKIDIENYYSDYSYFKSLSGWEPKMSLLDGLNETITYYKKYKNKYI